MASIRVLEKNWMQKFAKNLENAMANAGVSQAELARLTGLSTGTIARYLTGERSPKAYHVSKIADVLGIHTDDLVGHFEQF